MYSPKDVRDNRALHRVLYTEDKKGLQVVAMYIKAGDHIGLEAHDNTSQTFMVIKGHGIAILGKSAFHVCEGSVWTVPLKTNHDIYSSRDESLCLATIYSHAQYPPNAVIENKIK